MWQYIISRPKLVFYGAGVACALTMLPVVVLSPDVSLWLVVITFPLSLIFFMANIICTCVMCLLLRGCRAYPKTLVSMYKAILEVIGWIFLSAFCSVCFLSGVNILLIPLLSAFQIISLFALSYCVYDISHALILFLEAKPSN